jgi:hypothetical protein
MYLDDPDDISRLISEDVRENNGLIWEDDLQEGIFGYPKAIESMLTTDPMKTIVKAIYDNRRHLTKWFTKYGHKIPENLDKEATSDGVDLEGSAKDNAKKFVSYIIQRAIDNDLSEKDFKNVIMSANLGSSPERHRPEIARALGAYRIKASDEGLPHEESGDEPEGEPAPAPEDPAAPKPKNLGDLVAQMYDEVVAKDLDNVKDLAPREVRIGGRKYSIKLLNRPIVPGEKPAPGTPEGERAARADAQEQIERFKAAGFIFDKESGKWISPPEAMRKYAPQLLKAGKNLIDKGSRPAEVAKQMLKVTFEDEGSKWHEWFGRLSDKYKTSVNKVFTDEVLEKLLAMRLVGAGASEELIYDIIPILESIIIEMTDDIYYSVDMIAESIDEVIMEAEEEPDRLTKRKLQDVLAGLVEVGQSATIQLPMASRDPSKFGGKSLARGAIIEITLLEEAVAEDYDYLPEIDSMIEVYVL